VISSHTHIGFTRNQLIFPFTGFYVSSFFLHKRQKNQKSRVFHITPGLSRGIYKYIP
jgi:hypothetical protein